MDPLILDSLQKSTLFAGMSSVEIEAALHVVDFSMKEIPAKRVYSYQGKLCDEAVVILQGELMARMSEANNRALTVDYLKSGSLIAPAFLFAQDKATPVDLKAVNGDVLLLCMPIAGFRKLIDRNRTVRRNFLQLLSAINLFLLHKIKTIYLAPLRQRLAQYLLLMARKHGSNTIPLRHSRQELADFFGVQKSSLIRTLAELEDQNAIFVRRKEIVILDDKRLRSRSSGHPNVIP